MCGITINECELIKRIICLEVLDPITATATTAATTTTTTKKTIPFFITLNDCCSTENKTKTNGSIVSLFYAHSISNTGGTCYSRNWLFVGLKINKNHKLRGKPAVLSIIYALNSSFGIRGMNNSSYS